MGANTKIEWTDHSWNPWIGCTKVSPGCANCYAEQLMDKRLGKVNWGPGNPRQRTSAANWKQVERWNLDAEMEEERYIEALEDPSAVVAGMPYYPKVFVASLADWLDPEVPIEWLADLLDLIRRCPHLDFLLLTKRPELWEDRLFEVQSGHPMWRDQYPEIPEDRFKTSDKLHQWCSDWRGDKPPPNVWIGTSVEDQKRADERIPALLNIPAKVRFLSCEPLLGEVDFKIWGHGDADAFREVIQWVICGGESGPNARPMHPDWARSLRDQCQQASVPFFFKQWGEWAPQDQAIELTEKAASAALYLDVHGKTECARFGARKGRTTIQKLGKAKAGRLLDGREWSEFPNTESEDER